MSESASAASPSTSQTGERSNAKDAVLIVFILAFLAGPFIFMVTLDSIVGLVVSLVYTAATCVALVFVLKKAETVVDRLSKGEDRFASSVPAEVKEIPFEAAPQAASSESAASAESVAASAATASEPASK